MPTAATARGSWRSPPSSMTKALSASNTSQSSSVNRRLSSASLVLALTMPTISARRATSTKRRRRESSPAGRRFEAPSLPVSAEGDRDDGRVPIGIERGDRVPARLAHGVLAGASGGSRDLLFG